MCVNDVCIPMYTIILCYYIYMIEIPISFILVNCLPRTKNIYFIRYDVLISLAIGVEFRYVILIIDFRCVESHEKQGNENEFKNAYCLPI